MNANPLFTALQNIWNANVSTLVNNGKVTNETANALIAQFNNYVQSMANAVHGQYGNRIPSSAITKVVQETLTTLVSQPNQQVVQLPNTQVVQQPMLPQQDIYNTNLPIGGAIQPEVCSINDINRLGGSVQSEVTKMPEPEPEPEPQSTELDLNNAIEISSVVASLPTTRLSHVSTETKITRLPDEEVIDCENLLPELSASHVMTGNMFTSNVVFGNIFMFEADKETVSEKFSEHINAVGKISSKLPGAADRSIVSSTAHVVDIADTHDSSILRNIKSSDNPRDIISALSDITRPKLKEFILYTANELMRRFLRGEQFIGDVVAISNISELSELFSRSDSLVDFQNTEFYQKHIKIILDKLVRSIKVMPYDSTMFKVMPKIITDTYTSTHLDKVTIEKMIRYTFDGHLEDPFLTDIFDNRIGVVLMNRKYLVIDAVVNVIRMVTDKLFTVTPTDAINEMFGESVYSPTTAICLDGKEMFIIKNGVTLEGNRFYYLDNKL